MRQAKETLDSEWDGMRNCPSPFFSVFQSHIDLDSSFLDNKKTSYSSWIWKTNA